MSRKSRRSKSPPFVMLPRFVTRSAAWRNLDPVGRALYLELRERFNGANNGMIGLGCREAAEAVNVGLGTASRSFKKLQDYGFVEIATPGKFMTNGRRATEWLLTELPDDRTGHRAAKTFERWSPKTKPSVSGGTHSVSRGTQIEKSAPFDGLRSTSDTQRPSDGESAFHRGYTSRYAMGEVANGKR